MIEIFCDICTRPLDRPGALVFDPPDDHGNTKKRHVCVPCWQKGPTVAAIVAAVQEVPDRWGHLRHVHPDEHPGGCECPEHDSDDQNLAEHTALTRGRLPNSMNAYAYDPTAKHAGDWTELAVRRRNEAAARAQAELEPRT